MLDFPDAPTNGQVFSTPKCNFMWNTLPGRWRRQKLAPAFTLLSPDNGALIGGNQVRCLGTSFKSGDQALWDGTLIPTTFVSSTELLVVATPQIIPEVSLVYIKNGPTDNDYIQPSRSYTYNPNPLVITSIAPSSQLQDDTNNVYSITINGTDFIGGSKGWFDGVEMITQQVVSLNQIIIYNCSFRGPARQVPVQVKNGSNGMVSNIVYFTIQLDAANNPPRAISVSPSTALQGSTIATLTVTGENFVNGNRIIWRGTPLATTYVSATQLRAVNVPVPTSELTVPVNVENTNGNLVVNTTPISGAATIGVVTPDLWKHSAMNESPFEGDCRVVLNDGNYSGVVVKFSHQGITYTFPGLYRDGAHYFEPFFVIPVPPNIRDKLWVERNGIPSANSITFMLTN